MSEDRIESYRVDVYTFVFQMLDAEPDWNGDDAGRVAHQTAEAFVTALRAVDSADASDRFLATPPWPSCPQCGRPSGGPGHIINECCCDPNNLPTATVQK